MAFCSRCGKAVPDSAEFCPSCGNQIHAGYPTVGATSAEGAPRSGFDALTKDSGAREYWVKRLIAFVIDAVIINVAIGLISVSLALFTFLTGPMTIDRFFSSFWTTSLPSALSGLVLVLYFTIAESSYGTTIGKSIFGLKVTADGGRSPFFSTAFIRNISKIYWVLLLLDVVIGLAMDIDYRKKLSDKYAKTTVVPK